MVHMIYHRLYHMAHIISYDLYGIIGKIEVWRIFPCKLKWILINMLSLSCFGKIIKFACFITLIMKLQPNDSVLLISACKVGCVFPTVIWSEFRMRQYRDDDHLDSSVISYKITQINWNHECWRELKRIYLGKQGNPDELNSDNLFNSLPFK